ncbi:MAG: VWA domain-containing protein [Candidatus Thorarchaeota archaeon]|nr:VWA domain-containing protein [Candidatus Thorarchaeota archaeon]
MMVVAFTYFAWIFASPINWLFGSWILQFPPPHVIIIDTVIYIPLVIFLIRKWLDVMTRRSGGPAAGIDTVEPGSAQPEEGDEWGLATRPYTPEKPSLITGPKSELRDSPVGLDDGFFVKMPDIDTGEQLFDVEKLRERAMIRSKVTSGGWIKKRVSSRAMGSLKTTYTQKHGRPVRSRIPVKEISSIHLPSTVMAAVARSGRTGQLPIKITRDDIRESVFTGKTPLTIILVIDVSLSMKGNMGEVRQFLERIENETRGSKDRTGIVAFKDSGAVEVQAPTTNWNKIYRALGRLKISGLTPLAEALRKAMETIQRERMRNNDIEPLVIIVSDFSPNIPLAQSVGPGHHEFTPIQDIIRTSRMLRKAHVRVAAVNVDPEQTKWPKFLKRPYHEALELAAMLRTRKEGLEDPIETILAVDSFRRTFGAYVVARTAGGRAYLSRALLKEESILGTLLSTGRSKARIHEEDLRDIGQYLPS